MRRRVLNSWIAVNNDPFERDRTGNAFRLVEGSPVAELSHGDSVVRHFVVIAPTKARTRSRETICARAAAGLATTKEAAGLDEGHARRLSALRVLSASAIAPDSRRRRSGGGVEWF
jgi:hypothetical protein